MPRKGLEILKRLVKLTKRVTDLVIDLPHGSPINTSFYHNLHLRRLKLFKTTSPHQCLVQFLRRHSSIECLDIGVCGAAQGCPLQSIQMPRLWDLSCPPSCAGLVAPNATRIAATCRQAGEVQTPLIPNILRMGAPYLNLTALHIDFDPSDFGLLRCVSRTAPFLTALKLTELCHVKRVSHCPLTSFCTNAEYEFIQ